MSPVSPGPGAPTQATPSVDGLSVELNDTQRHLRVDRQALAHLVREVLALHGVHHAALSITLVDDASIHRLNREHPGHDWPTDVITFPLSGPDEPTLVAELVVSAQMALVTARQAGSDPLDELALYLVHGLLHLLGFDDQDDAARAAMRRREAEVLAHLGRPCTFDAAPVPLDDGPPEPEKSNCPPCSA